MTHAKNMPIQVELSIPLFAPMKHIGVHFGMYCQYWQVIGYCQYWQVIGRYDEISLSIVLRHYINTQ